MTRSDQRRGVVIALGGNALTDPTEDVPSIDGQAATIRRAFDSLADVIRRHDNVLISHGNGPQVGMLLLRSEVSAAQGLLSPLPIDTCVADTVGGIGYLITREARNALARAGIDRKVVATISTVRVASVEGAPMKAIGQVFDASRREELHDRGWLLRDEAGGIRRIVPSPRPLAVLEAEPLRLLFDSGVLVIGGGGGGVPLIEGPGGLEGVEAVVDKDTTASLLAQELRAATLVIATNVQGVYERFGTPAQKLLERTEVSQARELIEAGAFGEGSMLPKVAAACDFVASGGHRALICHLEAVANAIDGGEGTMIVSDKVAV